MSGQTVEIAGYVLVGISVIGLILSEVFFRRKRKRIIERIYSEIE